MSNSNDRKTTYLRSDLHKKLKILSIQTEKSMLDLIDESVYILLEKYKKNEDE